MEAINNINKEELLAKVEEMKKQMRIHLSQSMKKQESSVPADINSIDDLKALVRKQSPFGAKQIQKSESTANADVKSIDDIKAMLKRQAPKDDEFAKIREQFMQSDKYKQMEAKKKLFSGIREYDKSSDVNEFSIGESKLWLDKTTRASLLVRIEAERQAGKDSTIFWSNGNEYTLPLDEAKSIINSVEVYASECYDNTQRHLKNAKGLTTIEEMESYDYKIGYPKKLKF